MTNARLRRRAAVVLAGIGILAAGATAVVAAPTSQTTSNQTSATPVGEPTGVRTPTLNPCTLITLPAAQGIVKGIAQADEAPLGPTCIYKRGDAKTPITLTVGLLKYEKVTEGLKNSSTVNIGKYSGVCGTRGQEVLYLSLGSDRVLNVVAPCSIARALAAIAASKL